MDGGVAVVTGAAAGTGRAIALRLAADGATVVVADVDPAGGQETVARIAARAGRARFVRADMTRDDDVAAMLAGAGAGLRVLVNNAGGGGHVPPHFPDATPAQWSATLALNLRAAMLATQLALAPMRAAGGGAVVNIASSAGLGAGPHASPEYAAAKAGLIRFCTSLAGLQERMGVRVNCVVPDWILTERAQASSRACRPRSAPRRRSRFRWRRWPTPWWRSRAKSRSPDGCACCAAASRRGCSLPRRSRPDGAAVSAGGRAATAAGAPARRR